MSYKTKKKNTIKRKSNRRDSMKKSDRKHKQTEQNLVMVKLPEEIIHMYVDDLIEKINIIESMELNQFLLLRMTDILFISVHKVNEEVTIFTVIKVNEMRNQTILHYNQSLYPTFPLTSIDIMNNIHIYENLQFELMEKTIRKILK